MTTGELNRLVAAEFRAELARQGKSMAQLAEAVGKSPPYVTRRLAAGMPAVGLTVDDVALFAEALNRHASYFLPWLPSEVEPARLSPEARSPRRVAK